MREAIRRGLSKGFFFPELGAGLHLTAMPGKGMLAVCRAGRAWPRQRASPPAPCRSIQISMADGSLITLRPTHGGPLPKGSWVGEKAFSAPEPGAQVRSGSPYEADHDPPLSAVT